MYANAGNVLDHPRAELDQALAYRCEFSVRQWVRLSLALDRIERPSRGSTLAELASAAQQTVEERRRAAVSGSPTNSRAGLDSRYAKGGAHSYFGLKPPLRVVPNRPVEVPSYRVATYHRATVQTAPIVAASAPLLKRFNATRCSSELKRSG
jgi:hypothetical protein